MRIFYKFLLNFIEFKILGLIFQVYFKELYKYNLNQYNIDSYRKIENTFSTMSLLALEAAYKNAKHKSKMLRKKYGSLSDNGCRNEQIHIFLKMTRKKNKCIHFLVNFATNAQINALIRAFVSTLPLSF